MTNNLVSVIVPAYQSAKYISEALDSLLKQTYENIEIIIIDDGSTDETKNIVAPYLLNKKIKYFYINNSGPAQAKNFALQKAKGQYIQILDADDLLAPTAIGEKIFFLKNNPQFSVVYSDFEYFQNSKEQKISPNTRLSFRSIKSGSLFIDLIKGNFLAINSLLISKNIFNRAGLFNEKLVHHEDWELWLRFDLTGCLWGYLNKKLALCRLHEKSLSTNDLKMAASRCQVLKNLLVIKSLTSDQKNKIQQALNYNQKKYHFAKLEQKISKINPWFGIILKKIERIIIWLKNIF